MKIEKGAKGVENANALLLVLILMAIGLVMVSGIARYSSTSARLNKRANDYQVALGAAEGATEKTLSQVVSDYQQYGDGYVVQHIDTYEQGIPTSSEAAEWADINFQDNSGTTNRIDVNYASVPGFAPVGGQYGPLRAFRDRVRIQANASLKNSPENVVGSVYQDVEFDRIPIFQ